MEKKVCLCSNAHCLLKSFTTNSSIIERHRSDDLRVNDLFPFDRFPKSGLGANDFEAGLVAEVDEVTLVADQRGLGTGNSRPGHDGSAGDVERTPEVVAGLGQLVAELRARGAVVVAKAA